MSLKITLLTSMMGAIRPVKGAFPAVARRWRTTAGRKQQANDLARMAVARRWADDCPTGSYPAG